LEWFHFDTLAEDLDQIAFKDLLELLMTKGLDHTLLLLVVCFTSHVMLHESVQTQLGRE
jgi:hypothetical protein